MYVVWVLNHIATLKPFPLFNLTWVAVIVLRSACQKYIALPSRPCIRIRKSSINLTMSRDCFLWFSFKCGIKDENSEKTIGTYCYYHYQTMSWIYICIKCILNVGFQLFRLLKKQIFWGVCMCILSTGLLSHEIWYQGFYCRSFIFLDYFSCYHNRECQTSLLQYLTATSNLLHSNKSNKISPGEC